MKAEDIMTKEVVTVSPKEKVTEVAKVFFETNFNGLPVVDDQNKVLGLITETDLMANDSFGIHIPSFAKILSDFQVLKMAKGEERKELEAIVFSKAEDIMKKDFVSVLPETTLVELLSIFNEKKVNPIPVVDSQGFLLGIVARSDVIKMVSRFSEAELDFLEDKK